MLSDSPLQVIIKNQMIITDTLQVVNFFFGNFEQMLKLYAIVSFQILRSLSSRQSTGYLCCLSARTSQIISGTLSFLSVTNDLLTGLRSLSKQTARLESR